MFTRWSINRPAHSLFSSSPKRMTLPTILPDGSKLNQKSASAADGIDAIQGKGPQHLQIHNSKGLRSG
ncbi:hypothetical protein HNY73_010159 [Argiope bruennichi]|uniref:Uncharacterized protein n=1 Tax=Argiope bruennichi TaxID=94029 RepID=A0A8T0F505_ARGBR|nr:hypothetical protein HNY73_010159 [Argiope bruennichi]